MQGFIQEIEFAVKRLVAKPAILITKMTIFVVLMAIMSSVFEDLFSGSNFSRLYVACVNNDRGVLGQTQIDAMKRNKEFMCYLSIQEYANLDEAQLLLGKKKVDAILAVPSDYSDSVQNGASGRIDVYMNGYSGTDASVLKSCLTCFIRKSNLSAVFAKDGQEHSLAFASNDIVPAARLFNLGSVPDSRIYYAIAMLLMLLFYGADYGNTAAQEEFFGVLGKRLFITPLSLSARLFGRLLGITLVNTLIGILMMLITTLVFNVNWGNDLPLVIFLVLAFSFLSVLFGAFLCLLLGNQRIALSAVQVFALVFVIVSGGFYPVDVGIAKYLSPNYYAKVGIDSLLFDAVGKSAYLSSMAAILAMIAILFACCVLLARRRMEQRICQ